MTEELKLSADGLEVVAKIEWVSMDCLGIKFEPGMSEKVSAGDKLVSSTDAQLLLSQWEARCVAAWEKGDTDGQQLTEQALEIVQLREELAQRDAEINELKSCLGSAENQASGVIQENTGLRTRLAALESQQAASVGGEREAFETAWEGYSFVDMRQCAEYFWQARAALSQAGGGMVPDAARDVLAERSRQMTAEGWTPEHDDEHANGSLATAASCYALRAGIPYSSDRSMQPAPHWWPWDAAWWKPSGARRMLVKAGALILAEIERLDRAEAKPQANSQEAEE